MQGIIDGFDRHKNHSTLTGACEYEKRMDASREGMESWEKLQEALSMYPKGTKLARIEFEAIR